MANSDTNPSLTNSIDYGKDYYYNRETGNAGWSFDLRHVGERTFYMTEKPKRIRNKAIFRDDNASLSQGQDKRWYFFFSLEEDQLEQLPDKLVRQASAIAQKVLRELILKQQAV